MSRYTLTTLTDSTLLHDLKTLVSQDQATTALLIAHLAEVDARRLYAPAGYPSLFNYCLEELHFSEESACRRIRAARVAREYPAVFDMLADGRLHLTAVDLLAPRLTRENAAELLAAAAHKSRAGIERLLAERFPQPDLPTLIAPIVTQTSAAQLSPGTVAAAAAANNFPSPATVMHKVAPLAPQRFAIQCTVDQATYELIRHAQALLGHSVPSGDLTEVIHRAFATLVAELERRKFAKTEHPRTCRASENARQIPASVKRAVWERDGGQCTFVGENGHRCDARTRIEFDHVEAVATGGHATVPGLRLRCRAHNQLEAERAFGRDFMKTKRESGTKRELARHAASAARPSPRQVP